jgi:uncharacterized membrane protein YraQ (UPF0718 family)
MYKIIKLRLVALLKYLSAYALTCLVPAVLISRLIAALVSKQSVTKHFGSKTKKCPSYDIASLSDAVLAVSCCTIFAYRDCGHLHHNDKNICGMFT